MRGVNTHAFLGGNVKLTVWLLTRERSTWFLGAEILGLLFIVTTVPSAVLRFVGLCLLIHLGYRVLTSLWIGSIPGRPVGSKLERRNQELRSSVIGFLNEVRRVEDYAQRARAGGLPTSKLEKDLRIAERRVMQAAAGVAKTAGRYVDPPSSEDEDRAPGPVDTKSARDLEHAWT